MYLFLIQANWKYILKLLVTAIMPYLPLLKKKLFFALLTISFLIVSISKRKKKQFPFSSITIEKGIFFLIKLVAFILLTKHRGTYVSYFFLWSVRYTVLKQAYFTIVSLFWYKYFLLCYRNSSELSTRDLQKMVQALPQYSEQIDKLSLHVEVSLLYKNQMSYVTSAP